MSGPRGYLVVALVVVLAILGLRSCLRVDTTQRNLEIFTEMSYSRAGESFSPNAALPGGVTQQPLVPGVVVRGALPLRYGPGPEEAQRAGRELENPCDVADEELATSGRELYGIYCTACHGSGGDGDGQVTRRGMTRPPSLHAARALGMADGEMFHVLTHGQGNMASHAAQLSPSERWAVVSHVRRLQERSP